MLQAEEFLKLFRKEAHFRIKNTIDKYQATHVAYFENQGKGAAVVIGPNCVFKSPKDCFGKSINDFPIDICNKQYRKLYFRSFTDALELLRRIK